MSEHRSCSCSPVESGQVALRARVALQQGIRDLYSRGNRFLAGCDGLVPGFCLHDELEWFTKAGFSPLEALQTATINPARFLGRDKLQGTIEVGKRADLVLLGADPLLAECSADRRGDSKGQTRDRAHHRPHHRKASAP